MKLFIVPIKDMNILNKTTGNSKFIIRIIDLKPIRLDISIPIIKNNKINIVGEFG